MLLCSFCAPPSFGSGAEKVHSERKSSSGVNCLQSVTILSAEKLLIKMRLHICP